MQPRLLAIWKKHLFNQHDLPGNIMRLYFITQLHLTLVLILMLNSAGSEYVKAESVRVASRVRNNRRSIIGSAGLYKGEA